MPSSNIVLKNKGNWKSTFKFLDKIPEISSLDDLLYKYGHMGVESLKNSTPVETSKTSQSWYYEIEKDKNSSKLTFYNSNVVDGANVAILIQYGHATKNGGYVIGVDYINPAIKPIFDGMIDKMCEEVRSL